MAICLCISGHLKPPQAFQFLSYYSVTLVCCRGTSVRFELANPFVALPRYTPERCTVSCAVTSPLARHGALGHVPSPWSLRVHANFADLTPDGFHFWMTLSPRTSEPVRHAPVPLEQNFGDATEAVAYFPQYRAVGDCLVS